MDIITIKDLEVFYRVGVPDEERAHHQRLLITVEMQHDFRSAAATDDLEKTIDYFSVSKRLLALGQGKSWKLIETVASEIASLILTEYHAGSVTVEVKKFIIPETQWISVKVKRP